MVRSLGVHAPKLEESQCYLVVSTVEESEISFGNAVWRKIQKSCIKRNIKLSEDRHQLKANEVGIDSKNLM